MINGFDNQLDRDLENYNNKYSDYELKECHVCKLPIEDDSEENEVSFFIDADFNEYDTKIVEEEIICSGCINTIMQDDYPLNQLKVNVAIHQNSWCKISDDEILKMFGFGNIEHLMESFI